MISYPSTPWYWAPSVIVNWEFMYSQLQASISQVLPLAQPWMAGSTNVCSVRSSAISSRPCWKASAVRPSTAPRTKR